MKVKYPAIPEDVMIPINISGHYYKALAQLLLGLSQEITPEEYKVIIDKIKTQAQASTVKELNIIMITSLVFTIEEVAKEKNLTKEIEVDVPDKKDIN